MNKFLLFLSVIVVACTSACSSKPVSQLKGTPVVKILSRGSQHWLITETIVAEPEQAEEPEQERTLKLLASGKLSSIDHAVSGEEYLSDIALGPELGQLWVAVTTKNSTEFTLRLIDASEILWELQITEPSDGQRPAPGILDYVRIVSEGAHLFIVGRSMSGFPFLAVLKDRKLVQDPLKIGPQFGLFWHVRMGGVYSVMDQLISHYRLFLAKCSDSIAVSWLTSSIEVNLKLEFYGLSEKIDDDQYVSVLKFSETLPVDPNTVKPTLYRVGDALLQGISCEGNEVVLSGSSRILEDRGSAPFIIRNNSAVYLKDQFRKSASAQTVLSVNNQLIVGGSSEWNQNPKGISIDGGVGFLKIGDTIETFGETRTEVRSLSYANGVLCYAGMTAGPTTHSHDSNPDSITGDGFVECRNL